MMKRKMIRKLIALAMVLVMAAAAQIALAEPVAQTTDADARQKAEAAMKVSLPDAKINYAIREREDGRYEWKLFFEQNDSLGVCKIWEDVNTIRKVELYDRGTENALTADAAMARLAQEKGDVTVIELDLDWDDGYLVYEGEAELAGRRYEFEMEADGRIIEWERD